MTASSLSLAHHAPVTCISHRPSGRFLRLLDRSTEPRLQSLLCEYSTDVPLPALHEAARALGEVMGKTPTHL